MPEPCSGAPDEGHHWFQVSKSNMKIRQGWFYWAAGGDGFGRRGQDKSHTDDGESLLGQFCLQELIFGAGEDVGVGSSNGRDQVMHCHGLAVESSFFVRIGRELDGLNGPGLLGEDSPQVAIVVGDGERQERFHRSRIEIGQEHGSIVRVKARCAGAAIRRDIHQELRGVRRGGHVHRRAVDDGAELNVQKAIRKGQLLGFGKLVIEPLHLDLNDGARVVARGGFVELEAGCAYGIALLADREFTRLRVGCDGQAEQKEGKEFSGEQRESTSESIHRSVCVDTNRRKGLWRTLPIEDAGPSTCRRSDSLGTTSSLGSGGIPPLTPSRMGTRRSFRAVFAEG